MNTKVNALSFFFYMEYRNTFPKAEHLYGKTAVDALYATGKTFFCYPIRVVFRRAEKRDDIPARLLVNAPKKRFKHAVDRNHIKRQLRESYRVNKGILFDYLAGKEYQLHFSFNYIGDKLEPSSFVLKRAKLALEKLIKQLP